MNIKYELIICSDICYMYFEENRKKGIGILF